MIVRVLGSAAGGGVPQWNCACANCSAARRGDAPRRSQSSFAVSADGTRWWLINCSPDIAQQIEAAPDLQPGASRGTPIAGVLFTDANIDHMGGLAVLRQSGTHAFTIYSSHAVQDIARSQPMCSPFFQAPHAWLKLDAQHSVTRDGLDFHAIAAGGRTPGFDGRRSVDGAVVAFAVTDRASRSTVVFAPVFESIGSELLDAIADARIAFVDGSFWSNDELSTVGVAKTASALGHLPIDGSDGSLQRLRAAAVSTMLYYCHVNNTNPVLDTRSGALDRLRRQNIAVAYDGLELRI